MFSKYLPDNPDKEPTLKVRCISCCKRERLLNFVDLKVADHICMSGQHSVLNIRGQQWSAYTHHAIVKNVEVICPSSAIVTMIHFYTTPFNTTIKIRETTNFLDLHLNEIHIIRYMHQTNPADVVLKRAEKLKEKNSVVSYSIYRRNCESFCNWCCIGNDESFQVESVKSILRYLRVLINFLNINGKTFTLQYRIIFLKYILIDLPPLLTSFAIFRHVELYKFIKSGKICNACVWNKLSNLWMKIFIYYNNRAQSRLLVSLLSPSVKGWKLIRYLYSPKGILERFSPPFHGQPVKITTVTMKLICIGDVISICFWFKSLQGVVSDVRISPQNNYTNCQIKVIYYKFHTGFGRGIIVEETIELDPEKQNIFKHDYSRSRVYEPEIVVQRAKQRLGETNYVSKNLCCLFCHWAKVNEDQNDKDIELPECAQSALQYVEELDPKNTNTNFQTIDVDHTRDRIHSSISDGKIMAFTSSDIQKGQIVEFIYERSLYRAAVCTKVEVEVNDSCPFRCYTLITVVHQCESIVREERFKFDLNVDFVYVYKIHPIYRHKTSDIITRALAKVGEQREMTSLPTSSIDFACEIVVKEINKIVHKIDEIDIGDVIECSLFKHEALVTEVMCGIDTSYKLKIIHYTSNNSSDSPTVEEECIAVDLKKFPIYNKSYNGYVTYPADIAVKRARSRLHERRFLMDIKGSSDLVHWSKVVQNPAIVRKRSPSLSSSESSDKESTFLLLPKAGQQYEEFQRFPVYVWSELYLGIIVECQNKLGILSQTDEDKKTIRVINYCTDRTIKEYSIEIDLQTEDIWIYKSHPFDCYEAKDVLKNARKRLGEKWHSGRKSWNFCKDCVLRKRSNDV